MGVCLSTLQKHIGIAEHDTVHRAGPVAALNQIIVDESGVYVLLQRYMIAIEPVAAAPDAGLLHHIVLIEHIGQSGHANGQEQTGIGIVACHVVVLLVEVVQQGQTIGSGTVGIH